jgi:chlorobactene glucosyltransferase
VRYSKDMSIMFWVFLASALLEFLLVGVRPLWRVRTPLAVGATVLTAFAAGGVVAWEPNVFSALLLVVSLYRVFNMTRITQNRMHEAYLRRATRRTTAALLGMQAAVGLAWWAWHVLEPAPHAMWMLAALVQLGVALVLLASTFRRIRHTAWPRSTGNLPDTELPTVTVAIPARNETEDLERCLESIIANDYPKLEILVLDDCSQNRKTSEIIRAFAHDGVRFIRGQEPSETWLPKNQAYDRLADEASGQYILFCGVDVRFGPESIRQVVNQMISHKKEMVAILPWRADGSGNAFTQSLRYWWELVPPRRLFRRPPVLSTCWVINRALLEKSGGFQAVARSITPEAHFARTAAARDTYSFVRASQASDIASVKAPAEQRATMLRTRYPQLHRRPENVLALTLLELFLFVSPFVMVVVGFWVEAGGGAIVLWLLTCLVLITAYEHMARATRTVTMWTGPLAVPLGMLYDVWLVHHSMWLYEFSVVEWKGRNVCIPAMHVIPHLPKLED